MSSTFSLNIDADAELFYSNSSREHQCIGHLRGDFGCGGTEFWTSWFPHEAAAHNTADFKEEFQELVSTLRNFLLRDRPSIRRYLEKNPHVIECSGYAEQHGYHVQTDHFDYCIRCNPAAGDYNFYVYCYLREEKASA